MLPDILGYPLSAGLRCLEEEGYDYRLTYTPLAEESASALEERIVRLTTSSPKEVDLVVVSIAVFKRDELA